MESLWDLCTLLGYGVVVALAALVVVSRFLSVAKTGDDDDDNNVV